MAEPATFDGIVWANGRVATRNYIGVLTSVNCSATVARAMGRATKSERHGYGQNEFVPWQLGAVM